MRYCEGERKGAGGMAGVGGMEDLVALAVARELQQAWVELNHRLFGGGLKPLPIEVVGQAALGRYRGEPRGIQMSRALVFDRPWAQVVEVLKHEMAHQYVFEVLGVRDETSHGPTFRRVCEQRAIDARAAGMPQDGDGAPSKVLERIRKLLALADSPNEHEARIAMNTARRLMSEHQVELATHSRITRYTSRQLGGVSGRRSKVDQLLAGLLTSHFGVQAIWISAYDVQRGVSGRALEISGSFEHVEVAEYVHAFVRHTAERLWTRHRREQRIPSDRDRQSFLEGVVLGFRERLDGELRRQKQEEGLVLVQDAELLGWFERRYPRRVSRGSLKIRSSAAQAAGREAGRELTVNPGIRERAGEPMRRIGVREEG